MFPLPQQARLLWKLPLPTITPDTWPQDQLQWIEAMERGTVIHHCRGCWGPVTPARLYLQGLPRRGHQAPVSPTPCSVCIKSWNQRGEGCCSRSLYEKRQKGEAELSLLAPRPGVFLAGSLPPASGPALTACTSLPIHYSHRWKAHLGVTRSPRLLFGETPGNLHCL